MALTSKERALLESVRASIQPRLNETATAHGLKSLHIGSIILDREAGTFTVKVTGALEGAAGKEGLEYDALREYSYPMLPSRGTEVAGVLPGQASKVARPVGATSRRPHKVIFERDGKRYTMPVAAFISQYCIPVTHE